MRAALLLLVACSCSIEQALHSPDPGLERMRDQPREDAYEAIPPRTPPEGTVVWRVAGGLGASDVPLDRDGVRRGQEHFERWCAPCHGHDGYAATPVARAMPLVPPPPLHTPRIRHLSDEQLVRTVRHGFGLMPPYGARLGPQEAQEVIAYVRALQLSQAVQVDTLSEGLRARVLRHLDQESAR